jgi:hypothetical protein
MSQLARDLDGALSLVLDLEDMYAGADADRGNVASLMGSSDPFGDSHSSSSNTAAALRAVPFGATAVERAMLGLDGDDSRGSGAVKGLPTRSGRARIATVLRNEEHGELRDDADQPQSRARKARARSLWIDLDRALARIAAPSTLSASAAAAATAAAGDELLRMARDVAHGRPDRWVRIASAADREAMRARRTGNTPGTASDVGDAPPDVVLGSEAASLCHSLLHALLVGADDS